MRLHRVLEHRHPMFGDVGAVIGVGERARQRADQAAHRRAQHHRVAVQQHEARVGIDRGQGLEVERVVRALERPAAADAAALQDLEREAVVFVRRALVDLEQPAPYGERSRSPPTTGS